MTSTTNNKILIWAVMAALLLAVLSTSSAQVLTGPSIGLGVGTETPLLALDIKKSNTEGTFVVRKGITGVQMLIDSYGGLGITNGIIQQDSDINWGPTFAGYGQNGNGVWTSYLYSRTLNGNDFAVVHDGDWLGVIAWWGDNGQDFNRAAAITAVVDGVPGVNDMPGKLLFFTVPDGSTASIQRLAIRNTGNVEIGPNGTLGMVEGSAGRLQLNAGTIGNRASIDLSNVNATNGVQTAGQTVASLPACAAGSLGTQRSVNNALSPVIGSAVSAGGSAGAQVWCNGSQWTVTGI